MLRKLSLEVMNPGRSILAFMLGSNSKRMPKKIQFFCLRPNRQTRNQNSQVDVNLKKLYRSRAVAIFYCSRYFIKYTLLMKHVLYTKNIYTEFKIKLHKLHDLQSIVATKFLFIHWCSYISPTARNLM